MHEFPLKTVVQSSKMYMSSCNRDNMLNVQSTRLGIIQENIKIIKQCVISKHNTNHRNSSLYTWIYSTHQKRVIHGIYYTWGYTSVIMKGPLFDIPVMKGHKSFFNL